jgi:hypothetical protein
MSMVGDSGPLSSFVYLSGVPFAPLDTWSPRRLQHGFVSVQEPHGASLGPAHLVRK